MSLVFLTAVACGVSAETLDLIPQQRTSQVAAAARAEVANSMFHVGPLFLTPLLSLRDAGYNTNVYGSTANERGDYTATVEAGARYVIPIGERLYVRGRLAPNYVWYKDTPGRRELGGTYSAGATALLSRAYLQANGERSLSLGVVNSESERLARIDRRLVTVRTEIDVFARLAFFGGAGRVQYEHDDRDAAPLFDVRQLDRTETTWRAGARYKITSYFDVSATTESTRARFDVQRAERDNDADALLAGIHYQLPDVQFSVDAGRRKARGSDPASTFPEYDEIVGTYAIGVRLAAPVELDLYGARRVNPGLYDSVWFAESRNGFAAQVSVGRRGALRAFVESGANEYPERAPSVAREDAVRVYGASVTLWIYRNFGVIAGLSRTRYDSNLDAFDRTVDRITTGLTLRTGDSR